MPFTAMRSAAKGDVAPWSEIAKANPVRVADRSRRLRGQPGVASGVAWASSARSKSSRGASSGSIAETIAAYVVRPPVKASSSTGSPPAVTRSV
ncbi:hypothetical protein [Streptomyces luteocolor]|uniref:hypothetical protein n=1 Tax=Streptomyces luteocolor TaxID=285500 RepID=UPI0008533148|nr:hypothetical protein [Streptomyces luteocolor]